MKSSNITGTLSMADPNLSKSLIEDVTSTIERRLAEKLVDTSLTDTELSKKSIDKQNRELRHKEYLSKSIIGLLALGYLITYIMLFLSGSQIHGFYLEPYVLIALIVSSMGSVTYMSRQIINTILGS